ncbi:UNVERIFIED_CONTAM: hypothetical protein NCL1_37871 [Trichonephila clavipes]
MSSDRNSSNLPINDQKLPFTILEFLEGLQGYSIKVEVDNDLIEWKDKAAGVDWCSCKPFFARLTHIEIVLSPAWCSMPRFNSFYALISIS